MNTHPEIERLNGELAKLDQEIAEVRNVRAGMSSDFAKLENDQAAITERLNAIRKDLNLNRKRGASLGDLRDDILANLKGWGQRIDRALGDVQVQVETQAIQAGGTPTDIDVWKGTARDGAKKFGMSIPEVIEHAGGTIQWDDLSVSFDA